MNKTYSTIIIIIFFVLSNLHIAQTASLDATLSIHSLGESYIPYQNGIPVPSFEKQNRQIVNLKGGWKKQRFSADDNITLAKRDESGYSNLIAESQNRHLPDYDDSGWDVKNIPGVENTIYNFPKVPEYYEDGIWYRYKFNTSDSLNEKFIKLIFYSVNYVCDVWLNGNYLGYHEGGFTPFAFDVSDKLNFSSGNVLAIRIDNPEWGKRNDIVPYYEVDWFNYAGIIHDVYLEISDPVSVFRADIVPLDIEGNIKTSVTLYNKSGEDRDVNVTVQVFTAEINETNIHNERASELIGNEVLVSGTTTDNIQVLNDTVTIWLQNLKIDNPELWSPKNPALYVLKITLKQNEHIIDEFYTQFGIRTIKTSKDKVLLNGKVVFLTGVARHEDHPVYGRSIPLDTIFSDLQKVKDVNANMLRTAHYPNHPYTYLVADRLGIAIVEEIPVWWFDEPEPWQIQNNERHIHEQMFKEMIYKDFNRPSVILWSTCNECRNVDNRKIFIQKMWAELNGKIKDGRLVTQSAAADRPGPDDASQTACDVAGWTMYFGIFHGGTYTGGTNNFLVNAKVKNPDKPILDTEFGYWSSEDNSTFQQQVKVFNETFAAFQNFATINKSGNYNINGFVMGVTWWCIFDWYSHGHPNGYQSMGLYTMNRATLKPVGQVLTDTYAPYYNLGGVVTSVQEKKKEKFPTEFKLEQNYPNPFNPVTTINYSIARAGKVAVTVYNLLGKTEAVLVHQFQKEGNYKIDFDGSSLPSGIYFYELKTGNFSSVKKMLMIK